METPISRNAPIKMHATYEAADRYSYQDRDLETQMRVGGGQISLGKLPLDLNSVFSDAKYQQLNTSRVKRPEGKPLRNRVADWDPHELAAKVREQIDIDQLV